MKTFKYNNATIHVRGTVDKERLKNATIYFMKKAYKYKKIKGKASE